MRRSVLGHYWTVTPHVIHALRPERVPRDEPWDLALQDPLHGEVRLTGWVRAPAASRELVVIVHGLGGHADSRYVVRTARAAHELQLSYLRVNLRGADKSGEDLYHAAMTSDLRAILASPSLARFERIVLVGWSMGGHLVLRWAAEPARDPRVRAVVAVCAPLDLSLAARAIQRPLGRPYQWHVLRALKAAYRHVATRRALPVGAREAERITSILEWDERIVVPRFGFADRDAYYATASVGPILRDVALPALFVAAEDDPMVTADPLRRWLADHGPSNGGAIEALWTGRGGHVGFPDDLDLGVGAPGAIEPQILRWAILRSGSGAR